MVLILNPTGGRVETWLWTSTVQALAREGYFALLCDLRGQGRSFTPEGPYSLHAMAGDVRELLKRLGALLSFSCPCSGAACFHQPARRSRLSV